MRVNLTTSQNKVAVSSNNQIGRVSFSKVAKPENFSLNDLSDVSTAGQQDGQPLVYQASTSSYVIKDLPNIDCGTF